MVTCAKCGTQFDGRFCPSCGTKAPAPAPGFIPPPASSPVVQGIPTNIASVLAYLVPIIGPIFCLVVAPTNQDKKVRFDAFQALFIQFAFFAADLVVGFVLGLIWWRLAYLVGRLLYLAYAVLIIYMIAKSAQNQKVVLPYVGPLAEKQA